MDTADHLIAAAKLAMREGVTKEEFQKQAELFWNTWAAFCKRKESN